MTLAIRRLRREQSGTTAVEMAFILPLLILFLFGILEFGRAMATYSTVVHASREAARYGSTVGSTDGQPHYRDCAGIVEASGFANVLASGAEVSIWFDEGPGSTEAQTYPCEPEDFDLTAIGPGHRVIVEVSQPFELLIPLIPGISQERRIAARDERTIGGQPFGDDES